jgi:hypothetical protein
MTREQNTSTTLHNQLTMSEDPEALTKPGGITNKDYIAIKYATRKRREIKPSVLSHSITQLFHQPNTPGFKTNKHVSIVHNAVPFIYLIKDFLTTSDITQLLTYCTDNDSAFRNSFTEDIYNQKIIDDYRTSTFIYMEKAQNQLVRSNFTKLS